jgi:hypothetical protein
MESRLFVADEIRTLDDGKHVILGLYPDNVLIVHVDARQTSVGRPLALSRICMLANISGLRAGDIPLEASLLLPSGNSAPNLKKLKINGAPNGSANVLFRFEPFPAPEFGVYKLSLALAGETLVHSIELRRGTEAPAVPRPKPRTKREGATGRT